MTFFIILQMIPLVNKKNVKPNIKYKISHLWGGDTLTSTNVLSVVFQIIHTTTFNIIQ